MKKRKISQAKAKANARKVLIKLVNDACDKAEHLECPADYWYSVLTNLMMEYDDIVLWVKKQSVEQDDEA